MVRYMFLAAICLCGATAFATEELDKEQQYTNIKQRPSELPATVVIRKDKNGVEEVAQLDKELPAEKNSLPSDLKFHRIQTGVTYSLNSKDKSLTQVNLSELDKDESSRESWYFYYGFGFGYPFYYYQPYYYSSYYYRPYYPVYYYPYYNYGYGYYNYAYYRPCCW